MGQYAITSAAWVAPLAVDDNQDGDADDIGDAAAAAVDDDDDDDHHDGFLTIIIITINIVISLVFVSLSLLSIDPSL